MPSCDDLTFFIDIITLFRMLCFLTSLTGLHPPQLHGIMLTSWSHAEFSTATTNKPNK